ncbi:potassium transporter-domain-containing protein [Coniochaeta sp. 2T2.1]|nr:potassium transporter-domain-containing protein [Coniochaeta sp. 2T2.1]
MADGVLTPAQSVLGAVQGIRVVHPELKTSAIIGISVGILVFLFLLQPFGTARLGTTFAPIVTVWLLFNFSSGIYNLVKFDHTVLKAFSPAFAFSYFTRNGHEGWKSLGGILLAFTGVEALFADLGAFSKRAVQVSWLCMAYPCLLIAYIGQAAFISADATETAFTNPFFFSVPPGTLIFSLVIAILAAIVASQAMITSTFQLLVQVMRLSYFPHIKVVHTSRQFHDQVYIPIANWLLMIGTVIVTAVYNNTTSLGNAYGVCVIFVAFITTWMVALVAILIWRLPIWIVFPVFLIFAAIDGAYTTSVLIKVPEGAWFTLLLAAILSSIHILWRYGKEAQWVAESLDRLPASALLTVSHNVGTPDSKTVASSSSSTSPSPSASPSRSPPTQATIHLSPIFNSLPLTTVPGLGIFFDKTGDPAILPPSFVHFVRKFAARPSVLIFFHMRPLPVPSVPLGERFVVTRRSAASSSFGPPLPSVVAHGRSETDAFATSRSGSEERSNDVKPRVGGVPLLPDAYSVVLRHGYADDVLRPGLARDLVAQIELAVSRGGGQNGHLAGELVTLRRAVEAQIVYVLGKEAMRIRRRGGGGDGEEEGKQGHGVKGIRDVGGWVRNATRRVLLGTFLWIRENSRAKLADLDIDVDKLVEVGFLKEI